MKEIVFATNNRHKLEELRRLTAGKAVIKGLAEIGCHDDIPETADTLEGNARIKAMWVKERYGYDCIADDTGLEVDALGGAPGVKSARYAGENHDSAANVRKLLAALEYKSDRRARFRTVIALAEGDDIHFFNGTVEGSITAVCEGDGGFGYDPVFKPEGYGLTFAQMDGDEKNSISHRGRAVRQLLKYLSL